MLLLPLLLTVKNAVLSHATDQGTNCLAAHRYTLMQPANSFAQYRVCLQKLYIMQLQAAALT